MKKIRLIAMLVCITNTLLAQDQLPAMKIVTEEAKNIISWNCQYDGVKSIAIQRSSDSVKSFATIGVVEKPKKGVSSYTDSKPMIGKNYYRLSINFQGDIEWFSNTYKVFLDSATIAKSLEKAIQSGTTNSKTVDNTNSNSTTSNSNGSFYYTPSSKVFTNPYTGHININLEDALTKRYSLRFYNPQKEEVLRISRIIKRVLVLDKNNFNSTGTYLFELYEGSEVAEKGYITIY